MSIVRSLIAGQRRLCARFDTLLPEDYRVDGNSDFAKRFVLMHIQSGSKTYDVGSGKSPFFSAAEKVSRRLRVIGLDISEHELKMAPRGCYDDVVVADITKYEGNSDGELVICRTLLEHVQDTSAAIRSIASMLRSGGIALLFVPSRRAVFARLNLILPHALKRRILFSIFPEKAQAQGFVSYYDRCTPEEIQDLCEQNGLAVIDSKYYFISSYFSFFLPLYVLWRVWVLLSRRLWGSRAAETFALALRRV